MASHVSIADDVGHVAYEPPSLAHAVFWKMALNTSLSCIVCCHLQGSMQIDLDCTFQNAYPYKSSTPGLPEPPSSCASEFCKHVQDIDDEVQAYEHLDTEYSRHDCTHIPREHEFHWGQEVPDTAPR
eukprot:6394402-Amphidinium_carterae.1